jgi:hypothetical protein
MLFLLLKQQLIRRILFASDDFFGLMDPSKEMLLLFGGIDIAVGRTFVDTKQADDEMALGSKL